MPRFYICSNLPAFVIDAETEAQAVEAVEVATAPGATPGDDEPLFSHEITFSEEINLDDLDVEGQQLTSVDEKPSSFVAFPSGRARLLYWSFGNE